MNSKRSLLTAVGWLFFGAQLTPAQDWQKTSAPSVTWYTVVSSADGSKLAAGYGSVYLSTNSGTTWMQGVTAGAGIFHLATSADGNKLIGMANNNELVYMSTNGGATWAPTGLPTRYWNCVASSADGNTLVVGGAGGPNWLTTVAGLWVSTNAGGSWSSNNLPSYNWYALASSADGNKLAIAAGGNSGQGPIYLSSNAGANWTLAGVPTNAMWMSIASSADGNKLAAVTLFGSFYTSTNSGTSWLSNNLPGNWYSIVSSADGTKLAAAQTTGGIVTSTNSGVTWMTNNPPSTGGYAMASSADGSRLVAGAYRSLPGSPGGIYTWQFAPKLSIRTATSNVLFSWPDSSYTNIFILQQSTNLSVSNWVDATLLVNDDGTNKSVTLGPVQTGQFFRLRQ